MNTLTKALLTAGIFSFTTGAFGQDPLTVKQLHEATKWATTDFVKKNPETDVYGFTASRGKEEGALVRVYFNGGKSHSKYFCHIHDPKSGKVDCHELD